METDPDQMARHLGGLGTSVKLHYDRVPPETQAFDPENLLVFSNGLLCGTPAFSANRTLVSFISPQTHLLAYPMMGGFWASELKYAGYDKVIVRGKSPKLIYIWIHNDKVEIRDAAHLKGKGAIETQEMIREELNEPNAQVLAIGLGGENRCFTASIEQSRSSSSRGGGGAILGDKKSRPLPSEEPNRCIWPGGLNSWNISKMSENISTSVMKTRFPRSCPSFRVSVLHK